MSRPNGSHLNRFLTETSVAYIQSADAFVADKVFPIIPVNNKTNKVMTYNKADFFRDDIAVLADGKEAVELGFGTGEITYSAIKYGGRKVITDDDYRESDLPMNLDRDTVKFMTQKALIKKDRLWASKHFTTGVWGTDLTPSALWNVATSDPITDIATGADAVHANTGFRPNTLVLSRPVFTALKKHPLIKEQYKYVSSDSITAEMLKGVFFDNDPNAKVLVADGVYNSAIEGATASNAFIMGKHALLCYSAPMPSLLAPSAGYTFAVRGEATNNFGVSVYRGQLANVNPASNYIEMQMYLDQKVIAADLGYFFNGAVA